MKTVPLEGLFSTQAARPLSDWSESSTTAFQGSSSLHAHKLLNISVTPPSAHCWLFQMRCPVPKWYSCLGIPVFPVFKRIWPNHVVLNICWALSLSCLMSDWLPPAQMTCTTDIEEGCFQNQNSLIPLHADIPCFTSTPIHHQAPWF